MLELGERSGLFSLSLFLSRSFRSEFAEVLRVLRAGLSIGHSNELQTRDSAKRLAKNVRIKRSDENVKVRCLEYYDYYYSVLCKNLTDNNTCNTQRTSHRQELYRQPY